jgi:hypothetical protein
MRYFRDRLPINVALPQLFIWVPTCLNNCLPCLSNHFFSLLIPLFFIVFFLLCSRCRYHHWVFSVKNDIVSVVTSWQARISLLIRQRVKFILFFLFYQFNSLLVFPFFNLLLTIFIRTLHIINFHIFFLI